MHRTLSTLLVVFLATAPVRADSTAKIADIHRLMKLTGSGDLGIQVINQLMVSLKKAMPQVPEGFWEEFSKEVKPDELIEQIVPVYDRNLSHDDVKELIKFYESPIGKK